MDKLVLTTRESRKLTVIINNFAFEKRREIAVSTGMCASTF
jgi:hypothetical protein